MIHAQTPRGAKNLILRGIRVGGVNKAIVAGSILDGGTDRQFWDGSVGATLTVVASPDSVIGAIAVSAGSPSVTTNSTTATASGGSGPYTYAWTLVSADSLVWTATLPTERTSSFRAADVTAGLDSFASFTCTATDARGATGTVDVGAFVINYGT